MPVADRPDSLTSERIQSHLRPGEELLLTAASDVAAGGGFGRQWVVVTDLRVFTVPEDGHPVQHDVPLASVTEAKPEPHLGGGRLEIYEGNVPIPVVEYSSSLGPKFSE